jgi:hypothetical protein
MVQTGTTNAELIFLKKINFLYFKKVHSISENALVQDEECEMKGTGFSPYIGQQRNGASAPEVSTFQAEPIGNQSSHGINFLACLDRPRFPSPERFSPQ